MQNLEQNSEIIYINNEINLLQDLLKKNEKKQNQFPNGSARIVKIWVNKGRRTIFFLNQKNTKYSERYISKQDLANQKKY